MLVDASEIDERIDRSKQPCLHILFFCFITHYITIDYICVFALQVKQLVPNLKLVMLTDCTVM